MEFEIVLPAILGWREGAGAPLGNVFRPMSGEAERDDIGTPGWKAATMLRLGVQW
ncbi:MAG: hypothetical protein HHJ12_08830 [Glaciimonas sp.]|nr:hypothetical protein [Glaciimonas sp.]